MIYTTGIENILAAAYLSGAAEALKKTSKWPQDEITNQLEDIKGLRRKFLSRAESDGYTKPVEHIEEAKERAYLVLTGQPEPTTSKTITPITPAPIVSAPSTQNANSSHTLTAIKNITEHMNSISKSLAPAPAVSFIDAAKQFMFPSKNSESVPAVAPSAPALAPSAPALAQSGPLAPALGPSAQNLTTTMNSKITSNINTLALNKEKLSKNITNKKNSQISTNLNSIASANAKLASNVDTSMHSNTSLNSSKSSTPTLPPLLQLGGRKRKTYRKRR